MLTLTQFDRLWFGTGRYRAIPSYKSVTVAPAGAWVSDGSCLITRDLVDPTLRTLLSAADPVATIKDTLRLAEGKIMLASEATCAKVGAWFKDDPPPANFTEWTRGEWLIYHGAGVYSGLARKYAEIISREPPTELLFRAETTPASCPPDTSVGMYIHPDRQWLCMSGVAWNRSDRHRLSLT